jgi:hypothetical protein
MCVGAAVGAVGAAENALSSPDCGGSRCAILRVNGPPAGAASAQAGDLGVLSASLATVELGESEMMCARRSTSRVSCRFEAALVPFTSVRV